MPLHGRDRPCAGPFRVVCVLRRSWSSFHRCAVGCDFLAFDDAQFVARFGQGLTAKLALVLVHAELGMNVSTGSVCGANFLAGHGGHWSVSPSVGFPVSMSSIYVTRDMLSTVIITRDEIICEAPMRAIVLTLLLAIPAAAQDAVDWGGTGCAIVAVQGQSHVAEVTCWNRLTAGNAITGGAIVAGEVAVAVTVHHGPGDVPDTFSLTAPGFIVQPEQFDLDEHTEGVALVFPWAGM